MTILAEVELQSLIIRERFVRDTGQWVKLREAYHPDPSRTRIRTMWHDGDIDGFVSGSQKLHTTSGAIIHHVVPAEYKINGCKAVVDCWCFINARLPIHGHDYELKTSLRLLYRCEKFENQWKLLTLEPIYIHDLLAPVPPAPILKMKGLESYRQSYRFTAWMVAQRGIVVANDLPGEDDAKSVEELLGRHREWLNTA
ncbi:hypothetical protein BJX66DRAFT_343908 [Aspergillus keveii]|uniref:SnoaL-like domain-containing protein n=1 Tax=Aspergillus keveii TaxID=714993 RepID=A0ABR4FMS9_9EURO